MSGISEIFLGNWIFFLILFVIILIFLKLKLGFGQYSEYRELSKIESPIEEFLFYELRERKDSRNIQYQVYTQVPCGKYRIDLVLYTKRGKIAIECDGKRYHSSPQQLKHDKLKDDFLKRNGWTVFRFNGSEVYRKRKDCINEIEQFIDSYGLLKKKSTHMK